MAIFPAFLLLFWTCTIRGITASKPNFVLFMADDLGIGEIGCFGNKTLRTPNIDRLAAEGVKLTHHIAAAAICTPSRAAFMTGRYPVRSGMTGHDGYAVLMWNAVSGGLPPNETTFPKILKEQGYTTGIIGKWHLGMNCGSRNDFCHHPLNHGFDYYFGLPFTLINDCDDSLPTEIHIAFKKKLLFYGQLFAVALVTIMVCKQIRLITISWKVIVIFAFLPILFFGYWYVAYEFMNYWNCFLMRNFEITEQPLDPDTTAVKMINEATSFISRNKQGPFLLIVSFLHIHTPYITTKRFRGKSKHGLYGDNIEELDWMTGEILATIDQEGLVNNTLTYFTSDHGAYLEGLNTVNKGFNGIYRGGKGMGGLEGGIRVPGILRWPGVLPANTVIDEPTSLMDIYPTVIKLGEGKIPEDRITDGKDLMPLVQGLDSTSPHDFMFHYCSDQLHAVRWYQKSSHTVWKVHYISPKFSPEGSSACFRSKLCSCSGDLVLHHVPPLLYNLSNDPSEKMPIASDLATYQEVMEEIERAVANHRASLHPVPLQLYKFNNLWDPRLQSCCGIFPFCSCRKE